MGMVLRHGVMSAKSAPRFSSGEQSISRSMCGSVISDQKSCLSASLPWVHTGQVLVWDHILV